jgi:hypothetical protein
MGLLKSKRTRQTMRVRPKLTPENIFSNVIYREAMGIERYKGFLIAGSAVPDFATKFDWYSQGTIFRRGNLSSIVEIKRIQGPIFNSKEEAESHGLELCKDWIDKRPCRSTKPKL